MLSPEPRQIFHESQTCAIMQNSQHPLALKREESSDYASLYHWSAHQDQGRVPGSAGAGAGAAGGSVVSPAAATALTGLVTALASTKVDTGNRALDNAVIAIVTTLFASLLQALQSCSSWADVGFKLTAFFQEALGAHVFPLWLWGAAIVSTCYRACILAVYLCSRLCRWLLSLFETACWSVGCGPACGRAPKFLRDSAACFVKTCFEELARLFAATAAEREDVDAAKDAVSSGERCPWNFNPRKAPPARRSWKNYAFCIEVKQGEICTAWAVRAFGTAYLYGLPACISTTAESAGDAAFLGIGQAAVSTEDVTLATPFSHTYGPIALTRGVVVWRSLRDRNGVQPNSNSNSNSNSSCISSSLLSSGRPKLRASYVYMFGKDDDAPKSTRILAGDDAREVRAAFVDMQAFWAQTRRATPWRGIFRFHDSTQYTQRACIGIFSSKKTFDGLFFEQKPELLALISQFKARTLHPAHLGEDNRLAILAIGPPGTGKSTLAAACGNELDRDVLDTTPFQMRSRNMLGKVLGDCRAVVQLDEFDLLIAEIRARERSSVKSGAASDKAALSADDGASMLGAVALELLKSANAEKDPQAKAALLKQYEEALNKSRSSDVVDWQFLLTALDSAVSRDGRFLVASANSLDGFDARLLRRFDMVVSMGLCTPAMVLDMVSHAFLLSATERKALEEEFASTIPAQVVAPVRVKTELMHAKTAREALERVVRVACNTNSTQSAESWV